MPSILQNQLYVVRGGETILTSYSLNVIAEGDVQCVVSDVQNGHFETLTNPGVSITTFPLIDVMNEQIKFVHDGSEFAPRYNMSISDESNQVAAQYAVITFKNNVLTRLGEEFVVNARTDGHQEFPDISWLPNNQFVVVWECLWNDGRGGISGQIFSRDGSRIGSEIQIYTANLGELRRPRVTTLRTGNFVVMWGYIDLSVSNYLDVYGLNWDVYGRLFSAEGLPLDAEFLVNVDRLGIQFDVDLAALPTGGFIAAWEHRLSNEIRCRIYNASGFPLTDELTAAVSSAAPALSELSNGNAVLLSRASDDIYITVLNSTGAPVADSVIANNYVDDLQDTPAVVCLPSEGFVGVWMSNWQDEHNGGIFGRHFNSTGEPLGSDFQINTYIVGWQLKPKVATFGDAYYVVTWTSTVQDGDRQAHAFGVFGQMFTVDGVPFGNEFQINSYILFDQDNSVVTKLGNGFVVAWDSDGYAQQDGSGYSVCAQRFGSDIAPILLNHTLTVSEGGSVILSSANLSATDVDTSASTLVFTVSGVQQGRFERISNAGTAITTFTQADVTNGQILFVHDGGETAPRFDVSVSDGLLSTSPTPATIVFTNVNDAPVATEGTSSAVSTSGAPATSSGATSSASTTSEGSTSAVATSDSASSAVSTSDMQTTSSSPTSDPISSFFNASNVSATSSDGAISTTLSDTFTKDSPNKHINTEDNFLSSFLLIGVSAGIVLVIPSTLLYLWRKSGKSKVQKQDVLADLLRQELKLKGVDDFNSNAGLAYCDAVRVLQEQLPSHPKFKSIAHLSQHDVVRALALAIRTVVQPKSSCGFFSRGIEIKPEILCESASQIIEVFFRRIRSQYSGSTDALLLEIAADGVRTDAGSMTSHSMTAELPFSLLMGTELPSLANTSEAGNLSALPLTEASTHSRRDMDGLHMMPLTEESAAEKYISYSLNEV